MVALNGSRYEANVRWRDATISILLKVIARNIMQGLSVMDTLILLVQRIGEQEANIRFIIHGDI